ncbi:tyrosine-type recombinase/integrase [Vibrio chaetopteri]|uniref:Tyrosine-type recombinase/integrase n=1 Tax=Vibrio chaetopteri TaxID=3016528 RepID=A0AAU8BSF9_9VIBR
MNSNQNDIIVVDQNHSQIASNNLELVALNRRKRNSDSVTNPALSYISSLSSTNTTGGQANARYILERFSRFFLGSSYQLIDWFQLFKQPSLLSRALSSFIIYKEHEVARLKKASETTRKNLESTPLLEGLQIVAQQYFDANLLEEVTYNQLLITLREFNKTSEATDLLSYGWLKPKHANVRIEFEPHISAKVEKAIESFACYCITSCIHRYNWDELLVAPVVQASMNEYLYDGVQEYDRELGKIVKVRDYSPATVDNIFRMIRGVAKSHWLAGRLSIDDLERIRAIRLSRGSRLDSGRYIAKSEFANIMEITKNQTNQVKAHRDRAMLGLMYAAGLRRLEVVQLKVGDCDLDTGELHIIGKGNKERYVYIATSGFVVKLLRKWIQVRENSQNFTSRDPMFCRVNKHKQVINQAMTTQSVNRVCQEVSLVLGRTISPHDFRHSTATNLLGEGYDDLTVSKVMGHADPKTTKRYDQRGIEAIKKAILHL